MQQWLVFKIGYVCQIPQEGGGRAYLANSLYTWLRYNTKQVGENTNFNRFNCLFEL